MVFGHIYTAQSTHIYWHIHLDSLRIAWRALPARLPVCSPVSLSALLLVVAWSLLGVKGGLHTKNWNDECGRGGWASYITSIRAHKQCHHRVEHEIGMGYWNEALSANRGKERGADRTLIIDVMFRRATGNCGKLMFLSWWYTSTNKERTERMNRRQNHCQHAKCDTHT